MSFLFARFTVFEMSMMFFVPILCVLFTLGTLAFTVVHGRAIEALEKMPEEKQWPKEEKWSDSFMELEDEKVKRARVQKRNLKEMGMV
jgi:hypothetical protein